MFRKFSILLILIVLAACSENERAGDINEPDGIALPAQIDVQTAAMIKNQSDVVMIDVREQWEYDEGHIPGVTLIPMSSIESRVTEIPTDKTVILTCRSGNRSGQVYDFLTKQGFENVHNMQGGILAWEAAGLEVEK